jgi:mycobactin peptide synthetase MbtE
MTEGPPRAYPDRRLPDLVADHARRRPAAVAVAQWDARLTYAELLGAASALAGALRERGAGPEVLVGVSADRTPALVTGLLGVLLSGAGYVPLDPSLPPARLREMAGDAGLREVVCDRTGADRLAGSGLALVPIPGGTAGDAVAGAVPAEAVAEAVAYVMFTSGSTGRPKGVVVPHAALTEFVTSMAAEAGVDERSRVLGFASIGFDASVIDILMPLAAGGTVALAGSGDRADPDRLQRFCREHQVDAAFLPPAVLPLLDPERLPDLRTLLTGSEAPGPEQVARWSTGGRRFLNLFGPTETTVLVSWFEADGRWDRPLPIGRPAPNHRVYVVDDALREVAPGQPGELLAGGAGLARGYLGSPGRTADRFVPDPFSAIPGARLYRTGDLVRWRSDGTLQFLGRADRQVKVRGQRVEVGEVEAVLRGHPGVRHAAVVAAPGPGGTELVAFVTPGAGPGAAEVRGYCADRLPAAMVPARVIAVDDLPLGSSGKVDLDRLAALAGARPHGGPPYEAPATGEERQLAQLWTDLLGPDPVGRDDDFFDRGGHSITAMRLVAAVRARLGRDLSIEDIMAGRTLRAIAARFAAAPPLDGTPPVRGRPPALSPAQQRLWFLDRYSPEGAAAYNIGLAERLTGPLDVPALHRALAAVALRHEVLRWRITAVDGEPRAVADPAGPVPLPVQDLGARPPHEREEELAARLAADAEHRFDLGAEPLWRTRLYRLGPHDHVLGIVAHHAVFDGWSQALLYRDLATAYASARAGRPAQLPALPATYGDYVAWRAERHVARGRQDLAWWTSHLEGAPTVLELPADRARPPEQTFTAGQAGLELDPDASAALQRLARDAGATPSAALLAALSILVARLTGRDDLLIGAPTVDRRHPDFEDMVGFFIDIAPLRLRPQGRAGFAEHVRRARDELVAALAHPEAPLDRIVRAFGLGGQLARNPLVQVLFNMFNFTAPRLEVPGLTTRTVPVAVPGSPFDLTVYGEQRGGRLRMDLVYNADLYRPDRMATVLEALRQVVLQGLADPERPVATYALPVTPPISAGDVPRARVRPVPAGTEQPATPTEQAVAAIWSEVLGRPAVGATVSFFDAGGSSLAVVAVQQRLVRLTGRALRVVDLFRYPTVRSLAAHLDGSGDAPQAAVDRAAQRGAARRDRARRRPA